MAVLIKSMFPDSLTVDIRMYFDETYNEYYEREMARLKQFVKFDTTGKKDETYSGMGGVGDLEEYNGSVNYERVYEGYDTTLAVYTFAKGLEIDLELIEDDLQKKIEAKPREYAKAAVRTLVKNFISDIFEDGNAALPKFQSGGDGQTALFASAHPSTVPGVATQSNVSTNSLTLDNFWSAYNAMREFKNLDGEMIDGEPDILVTGIALERTAYNILYTAHEPGSSDWNANAFDQKTGKIKIKPIVLPHISGNKWFLINSTIAKERLIVLERIKAKLHKMANVDSFSLKFAARARWAYGFTDWRWGYGNYPT